MQSLVHSVTTLTYRLVAGKPNLEPLIVLQQRTLAWHEYTVTFSILGTSHAVSLESRDTDITEILSCAEQADNETSLWTAKVNSPVTYEANLRSIYWQTTLTPFPLTQEEQLLGTFEETLIHAFPTTSQVTPITAIGWNLGQKLHIQTIHTYPQEGLGVRSVTVVSREGKP